MLGSMLVTLFCDIAAPVGGYYLLRRDWGTPWRERLIRMVLALAPVIVASALLGWYDWARFGNPLETGLRWHNPSEFFRADFDHYGSGYASYVRLSTSRSPRAIN